MNYGLYLSASGALHNMQRQDILANNLSNINTTAFKPDTVFTRHLLPRRLDSPQLMVDARSMLERLGGGVAGHRAFVSTKQGNLVPTNGDLDVGVEGDGYFVVRDSETARRQESLLTRDGRFALNDRSQLVMVANGMRVLDTIDLPIVLDPTRSVTIQSNGDIIQDDNVVATLQFVSPRDPSEVTKVGHNLLRIPAGLDQRTPATGRLIHQHVESSAVDPIMTLHNLVSAAKSAQANLKMMQYHDHIMGQAINTLARVA